jgi:Ca2+/Na+ antiporter
MTWYSASGITSGAISIFSNLFFWAILLMICVSFFFLFLWYRKSRKLNKPVIELIDTGNGKTAMFRTKGGWLKTKSIFFGLWDYGDNQHFRMKDNRVVQDADASDYHDIGGKRGLIVQRKGDDPLVLVPISRVVLSAKSQEAIMSIAPADYRDVARRINAKAEAETKNSFEKIVPYLLLGGVIIFALISIIMIVKMNNTAVAEAKSIILETAKLQLACGGGGLPSGAP